MRLKLESRLPGEISITSDMRMTPPLRGGCHVGVPAPRGGGRAVNGTFDNVNVMGTDTPHRQLPVSP